MAPLTGKVAWVTGAGGVLGRATAIELAARGARVLVTGRRERTLGETVGEVVYQGGAARHRVVDVRDRAELAAAAAWAVQLWGRLDVVVACAGAAHQGPLLGEGEARASEVFELHFLGTFRTFAAAAASMDGGRLIALAAPGAPGAVGVSGAAVAGLVRALSAELGPRHITAHGVDPWAAGASGRAPEPEAVARLVAALAGPDGEALAGQTLAVGSQPGG